MGTLPFVSGLTHISEHACCREPSSRKRNQVESLMQSVSNIRTSDSLTAHEWDLGTKHNPLGLRRGLCLGEPEEI